MTDRPANDDMVDGYLDGFKDDRLEFPESLSIRGASYKHGWLKGRDERTGKLRLFSIEEALRALESIIARQSVHSDPEEDHYEADKILCALIRFLGHEEISEAFEKINKWYS